MPTTAETIAIGEVSQYLVSEDISRGSLFFKRELNPILPFLIYRVKKSLIWMNSLSPSYSNINKVANYLLYLCGSYRLTAQAIISGASGGGSIIPGTPVSQNSTYHRIKFIVGATGSPMADGATVYTLFDTPIVGSINIFVDELLLYSDILTQLSYTVVYNTTNTVITFTDALSTEQKVEIHYWRAVPGIPDVPVSVGLAQYIFTATSDNTTVTGAIGILAHNNISIVAITRDIFGLSPGEWDYNNTTGEISLLGGGANFLDTGGRLYILYVTT